MNKTSYKLVNLITLYRLLAAPALLVLLLQRQFGIFKWLLVFSFFTDAIDGWLARRFAVSSMFGARIDSVADDLTVFVAILGIVLFRFDLIRTEWVLVSILALLYIVQNSLAIIRFGKLTSFHTYTAKVAAVCQGIFLIMFYFLPDLPSGLIEVTVIFTIADLAEEILLAILLPKWEADVKGLYWVLKRK